MSRSSFDLQSHGFSAEWLRDTYRKIPPNPSTGTVGAQEIMNYMQNNQTPEIMRILKIANEQMEALKNATDSDVSSYDFASLASTIKKGTMWRLDMELSDQVGRNGEYYDTTVSGIEGLRPVFFLSCTAFDESTVQLPVGASRFRLTDQSIGLPTSAEIVKFIQRCIAKPLPIANYEPGLPERLHLTINLKQHADGVRPFLDSLPKPFSWLVEPDSFTNFVKDLAYSGSQFRFDGYMKLGQELKVKGNEALAKGHRMVAIETYEEAITRGIEALNTGPTDDQRKRTLTLLAILHSNLAATYLMPGEGMDAQKALDQALKAEHVSPSYAKAYIRTARAHQELGAISEAQEAIARGLRRPELQDDMGLANRLIELQTDGRGLPNDLEDFDRWMDGVLTGEKESTKLMEGLQGSWKKRCAAHRAALVQKQSKPIEKK